LDAKSVAAWGRIWWRSSGNVQIQTRSGNTEKPNETWSAWSAALTDAKGAQIASPRAKYLQWRAVLRGSAIAANLSEVNVSFLARNIAPEVLSIQILPPSVGLAANPPVQIDPNIELSGLDPQIFGIPNVAVLHAAFTKGQRPRCNGRRKTAMATDLNTPFFIVKRVRLTLNFCAIS
jgi:hypothetical protein